MDLTQIFFLTFQSIFLYRYVELWKSGEFKLKISLPKTAGGSKMLNRIGKPYFLHRNGFFLFLVNLLANAFICASIFFTVSTRVRDCFSEIIKLDNL